MRDLIDRLVQQGVPEDKALTAVTTVVSWVQEYYPVAGALAKSWIKANAEGESTTQ
jgi:hypothetical protein